MSMLHGIVMRWATEWKSNANANSNPTDSAQDGTKAPKKPVYHSALKTTQYDWLVSHSFMVIKFFHENNLMNQRQIKALTADLSPEAGAHLMRCIAQGHGGRPHSTVCPPCPRTSCMSCMAGSRAAFAYVNWRAGGPCRHHATRDVCKWRRRHART